MAQYKTINIKLSNLQLNKLKSRIKNGTEATLNLSSNVIGNSNDEYNFSHKPLLPNTQISRLREALANISSANIRLLKTQLHKIGQSGRFLGRLLGLLLKNALSLMENVLKPLPKSVLIPLWLTAATDVATQNEIFGLCMTTLIISNEEMNGIIKIVKSLEESGLLIKGVSETIKNEEKEQKDGFLGMLWGTLVASANIRKCIDR